MKNIKQQLEKSEEELRKQFSQHNYWNHWLDSPVRNRMQKEALEALKQNNKNLLEAVVEMVEEDISGLKRMFENGMNQAEHHQLRGKIKQAKRFKQNLKEIIEDKPDHKYGECWPDPSRCPDHRTKDTNDPDML